MAKIRNIPENQKWHNLFTVKILLLKRPYECNKEFTPARASHCTSRAHLLRQAKLYHAKPLDSILRMEYRAVNPVLKKPNQATLTVITVIN